EDAAARVRNLEPEVAEDALVERLRQVAHLQPAGEELALELEAEDDVEVVRDLVRVDAGERGPDPVDRAVETFEVDVTELVGKRRLQLVVGPGPKRPAPADEVLPHATLRLVQPGGGAARERRPDERRRDLPLVEAVPELVHAGEDAAEVVLVEPRRQADVRVRGRGRERVLAPVEPPRARVEAEPVEEWKREGALPLDRKRALDRIRVRARFSHCLDERHELLPQVLEHTFGLGRRQLVLEVVEQDVVRIAVGVEAVDVAALQLELPLEVRTEDLEVAPLARLQPGAEPERARTQDLAPELGRHAAGLLVVAPRDANQARLVGLVRERLLLRA